MTAAERGKGMSDLLNLADRVEASTGADRELDAAIAVAIGYGRDGDELWFKGEFYSIREPDYYDLEGKNRELGHFTGSLDAAMTLVPEGRDWMIDNFDGPPDRRCSASVFNEPGALYEDFEAFASSPALALTAASLRAIHACGCADGENDGG